VCQRLFIRSATRLPSVTKSNAQPYLELRPVHAQDAVPDHLQAARSEVYVAGAHVECGCGFPTQASDGKRARTADAADIESLRRVVEIIRPACKGSRAVELYLCWLHEIGDQPVGARVTTLADLRDATATLRHKERLMVEARANRRRTTR
jgi:hypothetical protein